MKINRNPDIELNSTMDDFVQATVKAEDLPFLMDAAALNYTDPMRAIIREYGTNALDAHAEAGVTKPIEITLPDIDDPNLIIQDFGIGMTRDIVEQVYGNVYASTKRDSETLTGGYGVGSKSAYGFSDQFSFVTSRGGRTLTVMCIKINGIPSHKIIEDRASTPEDQPGTVFTIPVNYDTLDKWEDKAKETLIWFEPGSVKLFTSNGEDVAIPEVATIDHFNTDNMRTVFTQQDLHPGQLRRNIYYGYPLGVHTGNIFYTIPADIYDPDQFTEILDTKYDELIKNNPQHHIVLTELNHKVKSFIRDLMLHSVLTPNLNDIQHTQTRESLTTSDKNKDVITTIITEWYQHVLDQIVNTLLKADNLDELAQALTGTANTPHDQIIARKINVTTSELCIWSQYILIEKMVTGYGYNNITDFIASPENNDYPYNSINHTVYEADAKRKEEYQTRILGRERAFYLIGSIIRKVIEGNTDLLTYHKTFPTYLLDTKDIEQFPTNIVSKINRWTKHYQKNIIIVDREILEDSPYLDWCGSAIQWIDPQTIADEWKAIPPSPRKQRTRAAVTNPKQITVEMVLFDETITNRYYSKKTQTAEVTGVDQLLDVKSQWEKENGMSLHVLRATPNQFRELLHDGKEHDNIPQRGSYILLLEQPNIVNKLVADSNGRLIITKAADYEENYLDYAAKNTNPDLIRSVYFMSKLGVRVPYTYGRVGNCVLDESPTTGLIIDAAAELKILQQHKLCPNDSLINEFITALANTPYPRDGKGEKMEPSGNYNLNEKTKVFARQLINAERLVGNKRTPEDDVNNIDTLVEKFPLTLEYLKELLTSYYSNTISHMAVAASLSGLLRVDYSNYVTTLVSQSNIKSA